MPQVPSDCFILTLPFPVTQSTLGGWTVTGRLQSLSHRLAEDFRNAAAAQRPRLVCAFVCWLCWNWLHWTWIAGMLPGAGMWPHARAHANTHTQSEPEGVLRCVWAKERDLINKECVRQKTRGIGLMGGRTVRHVHVQITSERDKRMKERAVWRALSEIRPNE